MEKFPPCSDGAPKCEDDGPIQCTEESENESESESESVGLPPVVVQV